MHKLSTYEGKLKQRDTFFTAQNIWNPSLFLCLLLTDVSHSFFMVISTNVTANNGLLNVTIVYLFALSTVLLHIHLWFVISFVYYVEEQVVVDSWVCKFTRTVHTVSVFFSIKEA